MFKKTFAISFLLALTACGPAPQTPAEPVVPVAPAVEAAPVAEPEATSKPAEVVHAEPRPVQRPAAKPKPVTAPEQTAIVPEPAVAPMPTICSDCGVIASVQEQRVKGDASAVGTLGGAAAGGVAGAQFGKKSGKILATIGGAVLGGLAGREVEKQVKATKVFNVTVSMDDGSQRTVTVDALNGLAIGSKVKVIGTNLQYNG